MADLPQAVVEFFDGRRVIIDVEGDINSRELIAPIPRLVGESARCFARTDEQADGLPLFREKQITPTIMAETPRQTPKVNTPVTFDEWWEIVRGDQMIRKNSPWGREIIKQIARDAYEAGRSTRAAS